MHIRNRLIDGIRYGGGEHATHISKIRLGQPAQVRLNVDNDRSIAAKIIEIRPAFDEQTQSFFVEASFTDSLFFKISGTQLEANILIGTKNNALVIPAAYLNYGNKVMLKENAKLTTVKTVIVSSEWVEIISGLELGQTIIKE